ncbi:MAG TPA: hypothetical protein VNM87_07160, partial [Candidatus Udaeobacter sp.]|nr:hypothetical protein [Candidatus Udaeobacter sp.]
MKHEIGTSTYGKTVSGGTAVLEPEPTRRSPMIALEGVEKVYRTERIETVALSQIQLSVPAGEFISIMGPS